jgi:membrane protein YdbS with pleckstrin-like domain
MENLTSDSGDNDGPQLQRLHPASVQASRMHRTASALIQTAVAAGALAVWHYLGDAPGGLFRIAVGMAAAWLVSRVVGAVWYPAAAWRAASYQLDDQLLVFNEGVFWQSSTAVPLSRVQHTDVTQGPFERRFGIGRLIIHTAGDAASQVVIWGLAIGTAYRMRDLLTARIRGSDGV